MATDAEIEAAARERYVRKHMRAGLSRERAVEWWALISCAPGCWIIQELDDMRAALDAAAAVRAEVDPLGRALRSIMAICEQGGPRDIWDIAHAALIGAPPPPQHPVSALKEEAFALSCDAQRIIEDALRFLKCQNRDNLYEDDAEKLLPAISAKVAALAAKEAEIEDLRRWIGDLQSGMYVNCVYCGHRYGPGETTPVSMADALKTHIEVCPDHPMSALKRENAALREDRPRFFLDQDDDGHWYLVQNEHSDEWVAWRRLPDGNKLGWVVPSYAKRVDGPSFMTFTDPQSDTIAIIQESAKSCST